MRVKSGVGLPFLIPDWPRGDDDDTAAWDVWGCLTGSQVIGRAGSVGFCLLPTGRIKYLW